MLHFLPPGRGVRGAKRVVISHLYRGFGCIYAHKNGKFQKTRVSTTSCVFEYFFFYLKYKKLTTPKKKRDFEKRRYISISLVGFSIFQVLDRPLVGQKWPSCGTSIFHVQDRDYTSYRTSLSVPSPSSHAWWPPHNLRPGRGPVLRSKGVPLEHAAARVCREAGARASRCTLAWLTSTSQQFSAPTTAPSKSSPTGAPYGTDPSLPLTPLRHPRAQLVQE